MKIGQIILKGVNDFEDFSYSFEDEWTGTTPDSLLLMGINGSGKTTILRAIADLWDIFGAILEGSGQPGTKRVANYIFFNCPLAAIKINDFLPELTEPIWIFMGSREEVTHIVDDHEITYKIGGVWTSTNDRSLNPGFMEWQTIFRLTGVGSKSSNLTQSWIEDLRERFIKNRLGGLSDLPNMIFLESENRILPKIEGMFSVIPEKDIFNWLARYSSSARREGSIFNYLFTLKAIDEESYDRIISEANKFLTDKAITGFDQKSKELMIKTKSGKSHPAYLLSSGEKQVLLMIAFITRELRPGGIVLIDEPDLHLHVSLSNAFVSHLRQMVTNKKGQLILASHASELWERFTEAQKVKLGLLAEVA